MRDFDFADKAVYIPRVGQYPRDKGRASSESQTSEELGSSAGIIDITCMIMALNLKLDVVNAKKFFLDTSLLCILGLVILIFNEWVTPTQRGYSANDESLAHPYHESTVPSWMAFVVGFTVPTVIILWHECLDLT